MDENSALRALRMRDEGALGWFIDHYTAYVATIVNNMLLPRLAASDAEEVVADVFPALWHNAANIRRAVDGMGEPDREIFLRHYYYCQSVADIAAALDMNANTVKTRLRRGRERLRAELSKGEE